MNRCVGKSVRQHARVATVAAAVSAGAAAVSLSRSIRRGDDASASAGDSGLVGLIERVADATSHGRSIDEVLLA